MLNTSRKIALAIALMLVLNSLIVLGSTTEWTWIDGFSSNLNTAGLYGELNVPNATNLPGSRYYSSSTTINNSLYLFGGIGFDSESNSGRLNDMWVFDVLTEQAEFIGTSFKRTVDSHNL